MINTIDYCLKGENWKDIVGYEGIYQASDHGRIRTVQGKTTFTVKHGIRKWEGRIMKPRGINPVTGHRVTLWKNKISKEYLVARLICSTFIGIPENPAMTVNHIDGNRFNNNLNNLEWLSLADNIRHAFETNLMGTNMPLVIKVMGKIHPFNSKSEASKFIGRCHNYVSYCTLKNRKMTTKSGHLVEVV